jgi:glycosyltransferase involved in cell wall biosynthesis
MNITFIAPHASLSGGIRVIAMHALELQRRGHKVLVISQPLPGDSFRTRVRMALKGHAWKRSKEPHPSHFDGLPIEHRVLDRARPVTDADVPDADAVIATWWETAEWVGRLSDRKGVKAYLIQGDEACFYEDAAGQERVAATWRLPLRKMAVAGWLVELARDRCPGHDVRIVPNAVDTGHFTAPARGKQGRPSIGFVSSPFSGKGVEVMLGAFAKVRADFPTLRLISFGETASPEAGVWPAEFPLEVRPRQERIPMLYASCDAWLFGSKREGFGLPILEAMACRTPVIATPAGAAPELLAGGGGILVKPGDPVDMAIAITRVLSLPDSQWREMSSAAYATAASHTWKHSADKLEEVLRDAAASGTS